MPEDVPLEHPMVSKAIEQAQIKVESFYFDSRKHLVEYDDVLNKQREIIYKKRRQVLENENLKEKMLAILQTQAEILVAGQTEPKELIKELVQIIPFDPASQKRLETQLGKQPESLPEIVSKTFHQREQQLGETLMLQIIKVVLLSTIDNLWINHLDAIDDLREGIGLRGYGQRDPLVEYKAEAFTMFERLIKSIDFEAARRIFRVQVMAQPQPAPQPQTEELKPAVAQPSAFAAAFAKAGSVPQKKQKLGRNDPCWCKSGKKFKKCHYPQQAA